MRSGYFSDSASYLFIISSSRSLRNCNVSEFEAWLQICCLLLLFFLGFCTVLFSSTFFIRTKKNPSFLNVSLVSKILHFVKSKKVAFHSSELVPDSWNNEPCSYFDKAIQCIHGEYHKSSQKCVFFLQISVGTKRQRRLMLPTHLNGNLVTDIELKPVLNYKQTALSGDGRWLPSPKASELLGFRLRSWREVVSFTGRYVTSRL